MAILTAITMIDTCDDLIVNLRQQENRVPGKRLATLCWPMRIFKRILLIKLINTGTPSPQWAVLFPRQRPLNCMSGDRQTSKEESMPHSFLSHLAVDVM